MGKFDKWMRVDGKVIRKKDGVLWEDVYRRKRPGVSWVDVYKMRRQGQPEPNVVQMQRCFFDLNLKQPTEDVVEFNQNGSNLNIVFGALERKEVFRNQVSTQIANLLKAGYKGPLRFPKYDSGASPEPITTERPPLRFLEYEPEPGASPEPITTERRRNTIFPRDLQSGRMPSRSRERS